MILKKFATVFVGLGVILITAGLSYKILIIDYHKPLEPLPVSMESAFDPLIIPPKTSAQRIAFILEEKGIITSSFLFRIYLYWYGRAGALQAGEYQFPKQRSYKSILAMLTQGQVLLHSLTIPEGITSREIKALLVDNPLLSGPLERAIPEGSLLPETYKFARGTSRNHMVDIMAKALQDSLATIWVIRDKNVPLASVDQAVILASIVEKETALADERGLVASVFINRLCQGMPLQSDPTVIYALILADNTLLKRELSRYDLEYVSPYNTYLNRGLPPTPICHPGLASLKAVLNPPKSAFLFFVADGTGGHIFAETYTEHQKNHAAWRRIRSAGAAAKKE